MPNLSKAAGADVPHVFRQVFANAAARVADPTVYAADDVNKIALQVDTGEQYRLSNHSPTTWTLITGTGFAPAVPIGHVALADGANIATDASLGNVFEVVIDGNRTLDAPTNLTPGALYHWIVEQGAGAPYMITLDAIFKTLGGSGFGVSGIPGDRDQGTFVYDGTNLNQVGFIINGLA